jgi:hypothetical protein
MRKKFVYIVERLVFDVNTDRYELFDYCTEYFSTKKKAEEMVDSTIDTESFRLIEMNFSNPMSIYNLETFDLDSNGVPFRKLRLIITKKEINEFDYSH